MGWRQAGGERHCGTSRRRASACSGVLVDFQQAKERGARVFSPPETHPFGERQYTAEDINGRRWTFSQSVADVAPEDWGGTPAKVGP